MLAKKLKFYNKIILNIININNDCPVYNEFELKMNPIAKNKDYQVQKENLIP